MKIKINCNWKVFFLYPFYSFGNRSFFRCLIFVFPAITYGSLLSLMKIPFLTSFSAALIMFLNILVLCSSMAIVGTISFLCKAILLNNFIASHIVGAVYYVMCSAWISTINVDHLSRSKSQAKILSIINITRKKWSRAELLMIILIPFLVIITNYINASMLIIGLEIMP